MTTTTVLWHTTLDESSGPTAPLVVGLHGRGADERDVVAHWLDPLPAHPSSYADG